MSGLDASELFVAGTGHIYSAGVDTAMPPAGTAPPVAWTDHGFATEDAVVFTFGKTTDQIKGWQSFDTLREIVTEAPKTFTFTLMQSNPANLQLALGGGTVSATGLYTPPDASYIDLRAIYITADDGGEVWEFWAPRCLLSDNVEVPWHKSGAAEMPLTFSIQAATVPFNFQFPDSWLPEANGNGAALEAEAA